MCTSSPKSQPLPPPPPPPAPPKPIQFGADQTSQSSSKKSSNARKSLSIPLAVGGMNPTGNGINLPS